jgi:hypothetical protein
MGGVDRERAAAATGLPEGYAGRSAGHRTRAECAGA